MKTIVGFILLFFSSRGLTSDETVVDILIKSCSRNSEKEICLQAIDSIKKGVKLEELVENAVSLPVDKKTETTLVNDPQTFNTKFYCLAMYHGIIPQEGMEPNIFPYVVYGFSFKNESLKKYKQWLNTTAADKCKKQLNELKLKPEIPQATNKYSLVLNPISFLENGAGDNFKFLAKQNYNHERLHLLFAEMGGDKKIRFFLKKMSAGEIEQFKREHPGYNFTDMKILAREFFSYTFESNPEQAIRFLEKDWKSLNSIALNELLCSWCSIKDSAFIGKVKDLASLEPKELIGSIEIEGIKVLILSANRKTPSKFFTWGSVRIDDGPLSQISKIEGSMGKTLCKGERPESKSSPTIVLAADSPYSTLIHEYIHWYQIKNDPSWCPVSLRLWEMPPTSADTKMIRDREWDVRKLLWEIIGSPKMTIEDHIIIADGLLREAELRKLYDTSAAAFVNSERAKEFFQKQLDAYKKMLNVTQ